MASSTASRWVAMAIATALMSGIAFGRDSRPDPLLAVEQGRVTVVDRIVQAWSKSFEQTQGMSSEDLRDMLMGLRADHLLAASLAGSLEGVRDVLSRAVLQDQPVREGRVATKALGDANADLVFTPLAPCRIVDTRGAGGALSPNVTRVFDGFSANFATQGGHTAGCGIPNGVAALVMTVTATNAATNSFLRVWAQGGTEPGASTMNFQSSIVAIATGTIVPVNSGNLNRFAVKSGAGVDFIADVVGYFRAPTSSTLPKASHHIARSGSLGAIGTTCSGYPNLSITVAAPVAGKVALRGNVQVQYSHTNGTAPSAAVYIGTSSNDCNALFGYSVIHQAVSGEPSGTYYPWLTPIGEFSVSAGTHTYYLTAFASVASKYHFWWGAMEATFFPD